MICSGVAPTASKALASHTRKLCIDSCRARSWDWVMGTFRLHPQDVGSIEMRRKQDQEQKQEARALELASAQASAQAPAQAPAQASAKLPVGKEKKG